MSKSGDKIPLSAVLEEFSKDSNAPSIDVVQRLRDVGIFKPKGAMLSSGEAERLKQILTLRRNIGKATSHDQLAFYMALCGISGAPAQLIASHMRTDIRKFLSIGERILDRQGSGRRQQLANKPVEEAAAEISIRRFFRNAGLRNRDDLKLVREAFLEYATVFLGTIYFRKTLNSQIDHLRRAMYLSLNDESRVDEQIEEAKKFLADALPSLSLNFSSNKMSNDVKRISKANPASLHVAAQDAAALLKLLYTSLQDIPDLEMPHFSKSVQYQFDRIVTPLPALLATIALQAREDERSAAFFDQVRSGTTFGLRDTFTRLYNEGNDKMTPRQSSENRS